MSINAATIAAMRAAGLTDSQILDVVQKDAEARAEKARAANRYRQARHRARNACNADNARNAEIGVTSVTTVTEEASSRACSNTNLPTEDISYIPPLVPPSVETAVRKANRAKPRKAIAADAQPTDADRRSAGDAGMDAQAFRAEWQQFRDYHLSRGNLMADWSAAWRTWCGNFTKRQQPRAGPRPLSRLAQIATQGMFDDQSQPTDHGNSYAATGANAGGFGPSGGLSERAGTDPGGTVVDLRPSGSGWR